MKRIASILLTVVILLQLGFSVMATDVPDDLKDYKTEFDILFKLDMLKTDKYGNFAPSINLKRGEMCYTLAKMAGVGLESQFEPIFTDVFEDTPDAEAIIALKRRSIISGVGDGSFHPNDYTRTRDVLVPVIKILGYNELAIEYGGYPTGYIVIANKLKLLKNVESGLDDYITKLDFARIIKNAIESPLYEIIEIKGDTIVKGETEHTLLSRYHNTLKISGIISANEYGGISGAKVGAEEVAIGDEIFLAGDTDAKTYLGYNVDAYYDKDSKEIISIGLNKRCTYYRITDDMQPEFSGNTLSYTKSNDRTAKVTIPASATILYNLKPINDIRSITGDLADAVITCIDNDGDSRIDTMAVNKYRHKIVQYLDIGAELLFLKDETSPIDLSFIKHEFYDFDGNRIDETYVKKGYAISILESEDGKNVQFFVSNHFLTGTVEAMLDSGLKVRIDGITYRFGQGFDTSKLRLGEEMSFQTSIDGKIIGIRDQILGEDASIGYIVSYEYKPFEKELEISMAVKGEDETVGYLVKDRIEIDGQRKKPQEVYQRLENNRNNNFEAIVLYETDSSNHLIALNTLCHDPGEDPKTELYQSHEADGLDYKWRSSARMFNIDKQDNNQIILADQAVSMYVSESDRGTPECIITDFSLGNDATKSGFDTYKIGKNSMADSIVVFYESGVRTQNFDRYMSLSVIEEISELYNEETDEIQNCVTLRTGGVKQEKRIKTEKEDNFSFGIDPSNDPLCTKYGLGDGEDTAYVRLMPGDIAKISYSVDGEINGGRVLFRYEDKAIENQTLLTDGAGETYPELYNVKDFHGEARCLYGYVYDIEDNVLLISKYSPEYIASQGWTREQMERMCEKHRIAKEIYTWDGSLRGEKMDVADVEEIYSVCKNGSLASRVFIYSIYSTDQLMIVYKDE